MPFGQTSAGFVAHQITMVKGRRLKAQSSIEQKLPRGGLQQVGPTHHLRNFHRIVVSNYGELIGGNVVTAPDYEIAEIDPTNKRL